VKEWSYLSFTVVWDFGGGRRMESPIVRGSPFITMNFFGVDAFIAFGTQTNYNPPFLNLKAVNGTVLGDNPQVTITTDALHLRSSTTSKKRRK